MNGSDYTRLLIQFMNASTFSLSLPVFVQPTLMTMSPRIEFVARLNEGCCALLCVLYRYDCVVWLRLCLTRICLKEVSSFVSFCFTMLRLRREKPDFVCINFNTIYKHREYGCTNISLLFVPLCSIVDTTIQTTLSCTHHFPLQV